MLIHVQSLKRFAHGHDGSVLPMFALFLSVLLGIAGGAIDMWRANAARTDVQQALDAAVLAVASTVEDGRFEQGNAVFRSNVQSAALKSLPPRFLIQGDGSVEGKVEFNIPSTLLNIVGIRLLPVAVASEAAADVNQTTELTFTPITAKGIYDKEIFIFVRDASGNITSLTPVLDYDFIPASAGGTITSVNNETTFTVTTDTTSAYGLMMRVWKDDNFTGTRTMEPIDYYSDTALDYIKRTGNCDTAENNNWEDTGDGDYSDFVYSMTCTTTAEIENVRLTK